VPTAGAIANAIARAIGARVRALPMTPERVWAARREAS
jgi:CO/xanthine dehydrogenase Mo-binding subunit